MSLNKYLKNLSDNNILTGHEVRYIAYESSKIGIFKRIAIGAALVTLIHLGLYRAFLTCTPTAQPITPEQRQ